MVDPLTFDVSHGQNGLTIVLSSTMEMIDRADGLVKTLLEDRGLAKHAFAVRVVMREGLTNSVRHAHKKDPFKLIRFNLRIKKDTLTMVIEDQGDGFDWKTIKAGSRSFLSADFQKDHGRGFLIMGDYFDSCNYNDKGNILTLEKNIST